MFPDFRGHSRAMEKPSGAAQGRRRSFLKLGAAAAGTCPVAGRLACESGRAERAACGGAVVPLLRARRRQSALRLAFEV